MTAMSSPESAVPQRPPLGESPSGSSITPAGLGWPQDAGQAAAADVSRETNTIVGIEPVGLGWPT